MNLKLKNIGMIKEADVKLNGLTVIAGENDTGKSTVGKSLFSLIKTTEMCRGAFFYSVRNRQILYNLENFKNLLNFISKNKQEYDENANKVNMLKEKITKLLENKYINIDKKKEIENIFKKIDFKNNEIKKHFLKLKEDILKFFDFKYKDDFRIGTLKKIINYLFDGEITNKNSTESKIELATLSKNTTVIFRNNEIVKFYDGGKIFTDATYIDSPVIFQLIDLLNEEEIASKEYIPTIKDLKRKLSGLSFDPRDFELEKSFDLLIEKISQIINGEVIVKSGKFEFKRNNMTYSIKNTATGIKSFGILMMLLKKRWLLRNSILILDEPEVHLHPKWQLLYAKIIVKMVKQNYFSILVNSHSPYIIEALKKYAELYKLENIDFYLAENEKIFKIEDSNALTLERIFQKLSAPFNEFDKIDEQLMEKNG
ncbi:MULTISPECIES: AAA family ATPase [unclassified Lebetimonas]|uniref:AAA family ATPase n=1 Tax=unclassified Lebetimonas TaxID=2648158 RepID=UPI0004635A7F|nr:MULTISPECIES: AAA family ATPase [unclassified Lebetimonas]